MQTLDTLIEKPLPVRMNIYGAPGTGKTFMVGKLADKFKLHYISAENGHQTFSDPACVSVAARPNVAIYKIADTNTQPRAYSFLHNLLLTGSVTACEAHGATGCVACASAGLKDYKFSLSSLGMNDILIIDSWSQVDRSVRARLAAKHKVDWESESAKDMHGSNNMLRFYDAVRMSLTDLCTRIQAINSTNVIVITHTTDTSKLNEKGQVAVQGKIVPAGGSAKFAETNAGYFSEVLFSYVENGRFKVTCDPRYSPYHAAKSRSAFDCAGKEPRDAVYELFAKNLQIK